MGQRGSVILHVLVTGVIVALIVACLLRVSTLSYIQTARVNSVTTQTRGDEGALSSVLASWAANGACSNAPGYNCGTAGSPGAMGSCGCTCVPTGSPPPGQMAYPKITATAIAAAPGNPAGTVQCQVSIAPASDPMVPAQ
jgi:hypothetical protein